MKNTVSTLLILLAFVSLAFNAGTLTVVQPSVPKFTLVFYSADAPSAVATTKKYIKEGYIIKSFNMADDENTGSNWVHVVVVMEKY